MATSYPFKPIVTDGLVFYIDCDNDKSYPGSGTSVEDMVSNIPGTLTNGVSYDRPYFSFDGVDDYINYGTTDFTSGQELTIDIFLKLGNSQVAYADIIDYDHANGGFVIQQYFPLGSDQWYFAWFSGFYNFLFMTLPTLVPFHLSITFNSGVVSYYIDGSFVASTTGGSISATGKPMRIGDFVGSARNFNGLISSVKVYDRELTADEILQNYNAAKNRYINT
jgi:hypothetical protein